MWSKKIVRWGREEGPASIKKCGWEDGSEEEREEAIRQ